MSVAAAAPDPISHQRLAEATTVLLDAVANDGKHIPREIAAKTACVAVLPNAATNGAVPEGKASGVVTCRTPTGWSKPSFFVAMVKTPVQMHDHDTTDIVMLVSNRGVFAGTKPSADVVLSCYSHSTSAFEGVELGGLILEPDADMVRAHYQRDVAPSVILTESAGGGVAFSSVVARSFR